MRDDIFETTPQGKRVLSIYKATGTGYENAWFTNNHCRYRFLVGSRNSKKSKVILGYETLMKIISDPRRNVLIVRQNAVDNVGSTYENLVGCIYDLGLENQFKTTKEPLQIIYIPTGQKIIFRGLNNPTSLTSVTFAVGYLTDIIIEEAFEVTNYEDFIKIDGSVRGKMPKGLTLQITCCMNAWSDTHWVYQNFFKGRLEDDYALLDDPKTTYLDYKDEEFIGPYGKGLYLHKSTYKINEFRDTEVYDLSAQNMKLVSPDRYKVEFLGMWGSGAGSTYRAFGDHCLISKDDLWKYNFIDYCIGIDTGYSNGGVSKIKVLKGESVENRVRSATTMQLCGITSGNDKLIAIDEYFHSNDNSFNKTNTDNRNDMTVPQLINAMVDKIKEWIEKYRENPLRSRTSQIMTGQINIYVDCADLATRQLLEMRAREVGLYNVLFMGSSKSISIQSRVDYENYLMDARSFLIVEDNCPNLIREIKSSRRGAKGEARENLDDHCLNAMEYALIPMLPSMLQWKTFKQH